MSAWKASALNRIARSDDLHISALREDGVTFGTPTWIWSVVVDEALYVRAYNGAASRWHRAAMRNPAGRITAAGITMDVQFASVDGGIQDRIDEAYRAKYASSPYLGAMISKRARGATVRISPRAVALTNRGIQ